MENNRNNTFRPNKIGALIGGVFGFIRLIYLDVRLGIYTESMSISEYAFLFSLAALNILVCGLIGFLIGFLFRKTKIQPLIVGGILGAVFGFFASQYFPLFGGFATFGEPFSPLRMSLISGHLFLFIPIGIAIGFFYRSNKITSTETKHTSVKSEESNKDIPTEVNKTEPQNEKINEQLIQLQEYVQSEIIEPQMEVEKPEVKPTQIGKEKKHLKTIATILFLVIIASTIIYKIFNHVDYSDPKAVLKKYRQFIYDDNYAEIYDNFLSEESKKAIKKDDYIKMRLLTINKDIKYIDNIITQLTIDNPESTYKRFVLKEKSSYKDTVSNNSYIYTLINKDFQ